MKTLCGFCRARVVTTAIDTGRTWPDGRPCYTLACGDCTTRVIEHQARLGVTAEVAPVETVTVVDECPAYWRSHGCSLPGDHDGEHVCDPERCGDTPTAEDEVLYARGGELVRYVRPAR